MKMVYILLTLLLLVVGVALFLRYSQTLENFTSSPVACTFVQLGQYKLTTDTIPAAGKISISDLSDWSKIAVPIVNGSAKPYSQTQFNCMDASSTPVNVYSFLQNIMTCKKIPNYNDAGTTGVNSGPALILCLQNVKDTASTNPTLSRVFFVKCFVPVNPSCPSGGVGAIVGETSGENGSGSYTPVTMIQGAVGTPNTSDMYTLSYTICAASSRPQGFTYKDCCSSIDDTKWIVPTSITASDPANYCCNSSNCAAPQFCSNNICKTLGVAGAACVADSGCVSGICNSAGQCTTPLGAEGVACSTDRECASGTCLSSKCTAVLAVEGGTCSRGTDCVSGTCTNNKCAASVGGYKDDCDVDKDCVSGMCDTDSNTCEGVAPGSTCSETADCATGRCIKKVCTPYISKYCLYNPKSYDITNKGFPCSKEVGTDPSNEKKTYNSLYDDEWESNWKKKLKNKLKNNLGDSWGNGFGFGNSWSKGSGWDYDSKGSSKGSGSSKDCKRNYSPSWEDFIWPQRYGGGSDSSGSSGSSGNVNPGLDNCSQYYICGSGTT